MSTAVPELITLELITRLQAILTGNGYDLSVSSVKRVNRHAYDETPKHLGLFVVQPSEERNPPHDRPGSPPAMAYNLPLEIHGFVRLLDRSSTREDATVNSLVACVKQATAPNSSWHTFDGNAYDADWGTFNKFSSTDHMGFTLELIVRYRISELNPYTVRT